MRPTGMPQGGSRPEEVGGVASRLAGARGDGDVAAGGRGSHGWSARGARGRRARCRRGRKEAGRDAEEEGRGDLLGRHDSLAAKGRARMLASMTGIERERSVSRPWRREVGVEGKSGDRSGGGRLRARVKELVGATGPSRPACWPSGGRSFSVFYFWFSFIYFSVLFYLFCFVLILISK